MPTLPNKMELRHIIQLRIRDRQNQYHLTLKHYFLLNSVLSKIQSITIYEPTFIPVLLAVYNPRDT
jgi:hypothetical protein